MQHTGVFCARAYRDEGNLTHLASIDGVLAQVPCSVVLQYLQTSLFLGGPATCSGHLESPATCAGLLEWLPPR